MLSINVNSSNVSTRLEEEQAEVSACYICGKEVVEGEGPWELCFSCAGIIGSSLKSLYVDDALC